MNRRKLFYITLSLLAVSAACSIPFTVQPNDDLIAIAAEQTVQAYMTENAPTETPLLPTPTETPAAAATLIPTATQAQQPTATPIPCNQAAFVSETIPDGTVFAANQTFTKSWRLRNTGTCTWNPNYRLIFFSGDQMHGPNSVKLNKSIAPGEQVDFLVDLKAPSESGTYRGYWRLQAEDGSRFSQVFTQIKVAGAPFAVTSVKLSASPASFSGECPVTVTIKAEITSSSAGEVTYYFQRSDDQKSKTRSLSFNNKCTKSVEYNWKITTSDTYSIRVYIDNPNHQLFAPREFKITCTP